MRGLLGMDAHTPTDVMFGFTGPAWRASGHRDGCGIAFFENHGLRRRPDPQRRRAFAHPGERPGCGGGARAR